MEQGCAICDKSITKRDFLKCAYCNEPYHLDSTSVSTKRFYLMTNENKSNWKCDKCYSTQGTSWEINLSTNNSFESLSDEESTDFTSISHNSRLHGNCLEVGRFNMEEKIHELEKQNRDLQEKLQSAETEIEHILLENANLKKSLSEQEDKLKKYTICNSSPKDNIIFRKKKINPPMSNCSINEDESIIAPSSDSHGTYSQLLTSDQNYVTTVTYRNVYISTPPSNLEGNISMEEQSHYTKPTIYLIGDEQVKGLTEQLKKTRSEKWNDCYNISSITKPFAPSHKTEGKE
ncbi:unnamed protein product [Diatraea saccharalis]|uniref:Uncharacterized protein n=1 Tax=Diatraea saccharalis TaxID=40085 RepID=A0A9N9R6P2_9NEOP|nr:unnamed protein product [Diatraea saccharalis]